MLKINMDTKDESPPHFFPHGDFDFTEDKKVHLVGDTDITKELTEQLLKKLKPGSILCTQSLPLLTQCGIVHNQIVLSDYTHLLGLSGLTNKEVDTALSRATIKGIDYHTAILELTFHLQYGGDINSFHSIVKPKPNKKEPVLIIGNEKTKSEPDYRDLFHELEQRYREYDNPIRPRA